MYHIQRCGHALRMHFTEWLVYIIHSQGAHRGKRQPGTLNVEGKGRSQA
jgi:hypothetical protein